MRPEVVANVGKRAKKASLLEGHPDSPLDLMPPMTPTATESRSEGIDANPLAAADLLRAEAVEAPETGDWSALLRLSLAGPIYRHRQNRFGEATWVLD